MPASHQPSDRSPQEELRNAYASQSIELQFWQWPKFRLELVDGQFLVGGTLEGSRWLLKAALIGWGLEAAIAFAPTRQTYIVICIFRRTPSNAPFACKKRALANTFLKGFAFACSSRRHRRILSLMA